MVFVDRLFDSIFGYIRLTDVEKEIIQTPIFQRLHHIKQLGMSYVIFPTALHTRFSHSLGVLFIMDKLVTHIREHYSDVLNISNDEHQLLRLAALLHDIGHLPLSHSGEEATARNSEKKRNEEDIEIKNGNQLDIPWWEQQGKAKLHEKLSRLVVEKWSDLKDIFNKYEIDYEEIGRVIVGASADLYKTLLLHSELDADRLDYLLRDAAFLGVSYGNIELDHIVSMIACTQIEDQSLIGVSSKGIHAVEHYILARYFMYSQIVFSPKIWFLENLLKIVYEYMIECEDKRFHVVSEDELINIISSNDYHKFYDFNDHFLFYKMRLLHDELQKEYYNKYDTREFIINEHIKLILSAQIPDPLLVKKAFVDDNAGKKVNPFRRELSRKIPDICEKYGIPVEALAWGFPAAKPTKLRGKYTVGEAAPDDAREEAIRIIYPDNKIQFFIQDPATVLSDMADKQLQCFYLFVNPLILNKMEIDVDEFKRSILKEINLDLFL